MSSVEDNSDLDNGLNEEMIVSFDDETSIFERPSIVRNRNPAVRLHQEVSKSSPMFERDGTEYGNAVSEPDQTRDLFRGTSALEPPLDLEELAALFEMSGALRTNIDTYATNIDSHGHSFCPIVDLEDQDIREVVRQAILEEKIRENMQDKGTETTTKHIVEKLMWATAAFKNEDLETPEEEADIDGVDVDIPDSEIDAKLEEIRRKMIWEEQKLETFFNFCCVDYSFQKLRVITRQDIENLGNGYWEVLRNTSNEPVQFNYVPGFTVRLLPADTTPTEVTIPIPRTLLRMDEEPVQKRFRKLVQIVPATSKRIWFKEFNDPNIYSSATGKKYKDLDHLQKSEPGATPATELLHFKVHSSRSPYGIPRWASEILSVLGTRHAEEINLAYFENKSIPPMAILVSGGKLKKSDVDRLRDIVKNEIRGKRNFHKVLILQAEPFSDPLTGQNSASVKIEIKPLTDTQHNDAQFMQYIEQNDDRVGTVFRMPRLLRGDARDFNRATAESSLKFAESQVFSPLRKDFDWAMNRFILPALGIRYWKFVSKGPENTDMESLGELLNQSARSGFLSIRELREVAGRVFDRKFAITEDEETEVPLELLRLGIVGNGALDLDDGEELPEDPSEDTQEQMNKRANRRRKARAALKLMALEEHFRNQAHEEAQENFKVAHALENT